MAALHSAMSFDPAVDLTARIRGILKEHGRLDADIDTVEADADLYQLGMTSHASVAVMLTLESDFDVEFPDAMLKRGTFDSIASIHGAIAKLLAQR